ncbi:MAG: glycosyltransferase family 2 protein [Capsulimonadaceae bacterium]
MSHFGERVGIVLVNFNGGRFIPECLDSLAKCDYENKRIVVIDNASADGSSEWVAANHPEVDLVRLSANTGITGGHNAGIRWCLAHDCDYVLLLNNDTVVEPGFLTELMRHADPDRFLVPRIYFFDRRDILNSRIGEFDYRRGRLNELLHGQQDSAISRENRFVPMVNACALLIPRGAVDRVGYMDEAIFLYFDDTDYLVRAAKQGYRFLYVAGSVVYHKESSSSGGRDSPLFVYYGTRNRLYFMHKHVQSRGQLRSFLLYFWLTRMVYIGLCLLSGRRDHLRAIWNACADFRHSRMGAASATRWT